MPDAKPDVALTIRRYDPADESAVIALWQACELTRPWNDPATDIRCKLAEQPELFLVGEAEGRIVATAMAGYEGHRGSVYYLGVLPAWQGRGFGRRLMLEIERLLTARGCPKMNILVRTSNQKVIKFYESLGYKVDECVNLGKRLDGKTY